MTTDELRRLADLAESDSELMTALRNADTREEVVLIAQQHGVRIEESDLIASADPLDTELSDADFYRRRRRASSEVLHLRLRLPIGRPLRLNFADESGAFRVSRRLEVRATVGCQRH